MKINTIPVEAYRRAGNQSVRNEEAAEAQSDLGKTANITLPGMNDAEIGRIRSSVFPSPLSDALSSEETSMLVKHFARFGDSQESSQVYRTDARVKAGVLTGIRLDVKG